MINNPLNLNLDILGQLDEKLINDIVKSINKKEEFNLTTNINNTLHPITKRLENIDIYVIVINDNKVIDPFLYFNMGYAQSFIESGWIQLMVLISRNNGFVKTINKYYTDSIVSIELNDVETSNIGNEISKVILRKNIQVKNKYSDYQFSRVYQEISEISGLANKFLVNENAMRHKGHVLQDRFMVIQISSILQYGNGFHYSFIEMIRPILNICERLNTRIGGISNWWISRGECHQGNIDMVISDLNDLINITKIVIDYMAVDSNFISIKKVYEPINKPKLSTKDLKYRDEKIIPYLEKNLQNRFEYFPKNRQSKFIDNYKNIEYSLKKLKDSEWLTLDIENIEKQIIKDLSNNDLSSLFNIVNISQHRVENTIYKLLVNYIDNNYLKEHKTDIGIRDNITISSISFKDSLKILNYLIKNEEITEIKKRDIDKLHGSVDLRNKIAHLKTESITVDDIVKALSNHINFIEKYGYLNHNKR